MKFFIVIFVIILPFVVCNEEQPEKKVTKSVVNSILKNPFKDSPLKIIGKCISDHDCKQHEYCDHTGINPFGSCKDGKDTNQTCVFDRHCKTKQCHLLKCVKKKPVRDGVCEKDMHSDCIPEQYCHHEKKDKKDLYVCADRKCSGFCLKDVHCLTNKCKLARCEKPAEGCKKEEKKEEKKVDKKDIKKKNI